MQGEADSPSENLVECEICHLRTREPRLLTKYNLYRFPGYYVDVNACPGCVSRKRFRAALYNIVLGQIGIFVLAMCFVADRYERFDNMALFALSIVFSPVIVIVVHELAHAVVGRWVGLELFSIAIGSGPLLFRWHFRGVRIDIHSYPSGGSCATAPPPGRVQRWRLMLMIAAGPACNFILFYIALRLATNRFSIQPRNLHLNAWTAFVWVTTIILFYTIWPRDIHRDGRKLPNDLKRLFRLSKPSPDLKLYSNSYLPLKITKCLELGQLEEAHSWVDCWQKEFGESAAYHVASIRVRAAEGNWSSIWQDAKNWMEAPNAKLDRETCAAWAAVAMVYDNQNLNEAQLFAEEAMRLWPWDGTTQSVRALVLLAQGSADESELILKNLNFKSISPPAQAGVARMWVKLFERKGNSKLAMKWQQRADVLDPVNAFQLQTPIRSARFSG